MLPSVIFSEGAQLSSLGRKLSPKSSHQSLFPLKISSPSRLHHNISDFHRHFTYTLHIRQSSTISPKLTALLIATAVLLLVYTLHSAHSASLSKWLAILLSSAPNKTSFPTPTVVQIPHDIQFSALGHAAYSKALDDNGSDVVIIPRHGRMEYVIGHEHVREVLTNSTSYSFEEAVTRMLHMDFMLWFKKGTFVQELNELVQDGVTPRLRAVIEEISPVFKIQSTDLLEQTQNGQIIEIVDMYQWVHHAIAQAMIILVIGEQYSTPIMTQHFMDIVVAISNLSGIYENTQGWKYFPRLWSLQTTTVAILGTIVPKFFFGILPQLWKNREAHLDQSVTVDTNDFSPFLDLLLTKHRNKRTGKISFINFVWCSVICLGVIFASIHQTAVVAVWCIFNLAKRQAEYLDEIRQEITDNVQIDAEGNSCFSSEALRSLIKMDSFIREVMRTKGDLYAPVRCTRKDVQVGKYIIPKGSLCAPYVKRAHECADHPDSSGSRFRGFQWTGDYLKRQRIPAVQGSNDFISFGLGRWACPGRHLAIAEIKIILVTLFDKFDVHLKEGNFTTSDPMNATSVAPEAVVLVSQRKREAPESNKHTSVLIKSPDSPSLSSNHHCSILKAS